MCVMPNKMNVIHRDLFLCYDVNIQLPLYKAGKGIDFIDFLIIFTLIMHNLSSIVYNL